jgi:putative membrane protein
MVFLEILLAILIGIVSGTITGLLPGLHTNTIAILLVSSLHILSNYFSEIALATFIISMIITHSFLDAIPAIFLGAPEADTALGVLPGHQLLLQGKGYHALKLTVLGGIGTSTIAVLVIPILLISLEYTYTYLQKIIAPLLIILSALFILKESDNKKRIWALLIFMLSGTLGTLTLNKLNIVNPLFPLLTGFFGVPVILLSIARETNIPRQTTTSDLNLITKQSILSYVKASISSAIVSILPGIGAAQAAMISQGFTKFKNKDQFLTIIGGINTASVFYTLTTLYILDKARTGAMVAIQHFLTLNANQYILLLLTSIVVLGFAVILTLSLGKIFAKKLTKLNYKKISLIILAIILFFTITLSEPLALPVLAVATAIGLLPVKTNVRRIHAMGCLILPVIFYYIL